MAFSVTAINKGVWGDLRYEILSCSVDSGSGNIQTGLQTIYGCCFNPISMATAGIKLRVNIGSGATARAGVVNLNSASSGDDFIVTVFGK